MQKFKLEDFQQKYTADDVNLLEILKGLPKLKFEQGPWLTGGALLRLVTNEPISKGDLDFSFFNSTRRYNFEVKLIEEARLHVAAETYKAISWKGGKLPVQTLKWYGNTIGDIFNSFDFTICQIGTDGYYIYATDQGWADIQDKKLRFHKRGFTTVARAVKYIMRGYEPTDIDMWEYWNKTARVFIMYGKEHWPLSEFELRDAVAYR